MKTGFPACYYPFNMETARKKLMVSIVLIPAGIVIGFLHGAWDCS